MPIRPNRISRGSPSQSCVVRIATREANVLAYDDVFRLVAVLAALTFCYLLFLLLRRRWRAHRTIAA